MTKYKLILSNNEQSQRQRQSQNLIDPLELKHVNVNSNLDENLTSFKWKSEELRQPEIRRSINGVLKTTLHIESRLISDGPVSYVARTYEGTIPGPTLLLSPGDRLEITQINTLSGQGHDNHRNTELKVQRDAESDFDDHHNTEIVGDSYHKVSNTIPRYDVDPHVLHCPNVTVVHVHGMHVSPSGKADNVLTRSIGPHEIYTNEYNIPLNQQEGLFYYHPHYHGSSGVQVAGGMAGAIIVEFEKEEESKVKQENYEILSQYRDFVAVLQHLNVEFGTFRNYIYGSKISGSQLPTTYTKIQPNAPTSYFTVNGQYLPYITVEKDEIFRLRLVHAGINDYLYLSILNEEFKYKDDKANSVDEPPICHIFSIAADGAYHNNPRLKRNILMVVGSRRELLIRCSKQGTFSLISSKSEDIINNYLGSGTDIFEGELLKFQVVNNQLNTHKSKEIVQNSFKTEGKITNKEMSSILPSFLPSKPMPLFSDLRNINIPDNSKFNFEFSHGGLVTRYQEQNHEAVNYTWYGINGKIHSPLNPSRIVIKDSIEEWLVHSRMMDGSKVKVNHPFHLHVNHYQIIDMSHGQGIDYEIGDWRDSISIPGGDSINEENDGNSGWVKVRWPAMDFTGIAPAHCHIFGHSDIGMSMTFEIIDK